MVATITANPCRDRTLFISNFKHGATNRTDNSREDIGGKGINVSTALQMLGLETVCLGFADDWLPEHLDIPSDFVVGMRKIRTNIKIFEQDTGIMTELNERGEPIDAKYIDALMEKISRRTMDILVCGGSVPPGVPDNFYKTVIQTAKKANPSVTVVLDAEGPLFLKGLEAYPDIIKPNRFELESAFGVLLDSSEKIARQCQKLNVRISCVSLGGEGAVLVSGEGAFSAHALTVPVKSLQGAGDSMVAGICKGILEKRTMPEILRCAVAAATGSVVREGTLLCTGEGFDSYYPLVRVEKI